jgi:hypothetical protein
MTNLLNDELKCEYRSRYPEWYGREKPEQTEEMTVGLDLFMEGPSRESEEASSTKSSSTDKKTRAPRKKGENEDLLHKWSSTPFEFNNDLGINNGAMTIEQLRVKKYELSDEGYVQLINDCKACIGVINSVFYYRT